MYCPEVLYTTPSQIYVSQAVSDTEFETLVIIDKYKTTILSHPEIELKILV